MSKLNSRLSGFWKVVKKVTTPTRKEWLNIFIRVSLILLIAGAVLFVVDWLLLKGILTFQGYVQEVQAPWLSWSYLVVLVMSGFLAGIGVLSQQGSDAGLSSMLGSSVQAGDVTGRIGNRVARLTVALGALFVIFSLFSPIFLKGLF